MKFFALFELNLLHAYYTGGRCSDFAIEPTAATRRLLRNHRCVLKTVANGIRVLAAGNDKQLPLIPLPQGSSFIFQLRLENPDFVLFTDAAAFTGAAPVFTNAALGAGGTSLAQTFREAWDSESLTVRTAARADRFVLAGRPLAGLRPSDFNVDGLGAAAPAGYDEATKTITVDTSGAASGAVFTVSYPVKAKLAQGVFAEVEILANDSLPDVAAGPGKFVIDFAAKHARWKYYWVTDLDVTSVSPRIVDAGVPPVVFSDGNRTYLNQHPDPADEIACALDRQYADKQRFRFVSDNLIPARQAPRKQFQLRLGENRLADALPNPSLRNYSTMAAEVGGTLQKQDVLFHIIKHFHSRNNN